MLLYAFSNSVENVCNVRRNVYDDLYIDVYSNACCVCRRAKLKAHATYRICQRWTLWGLDIRDLEILGTGSWSLGGQVGASQEWVEERRSGISAGPGTEGAGTRVCGHVIKEE